MNCLKKEIKKFNNILLENFQQQTLERNLRILNKTFGEGFFGNIENEAPRFLNIIQNFPIVRTLGSGSYGVAYELNDGTVLKVGEMSIRELDIFEKIQDDLFKGKGSGSDLMVYDSGIIKRHSNYNITYGYALMEKLITIKTPDYLDEFDDERERDEDFELEIKELVKDYYRLNPIIFVSKSPQEIRNILLPIVKKEKFFYEEPTPYKFELLEKWIEFFKDLALKKEGGIDIRDYHSGNIGTSKRGKKVQFDF